MEIIEIKEKSLGALKKCPWNGVFYSEIKVQINHLGEQEIDFVPENLIVFSVNKVEARMSNPMGRIFPARPLESFRKYDGENGTMLFLKGIYLDSKNKIFLEFYRYKVGVGLPERIEFQIKEENIEIL